MKRLVAVALALGCGSKAAEQRPPPDDKPQADVVAFEPMTIISEKVIVNAEAPKGWTKTELTPNDHSYADPKGGMTPSTITISATCPGVCDPNAIADFMIGTQKSAGYEATVTKSTAIPNGIELELEVTKPGTDPLFQYVRFLYDPKLATGAQCMVMGTGTDAKAKRDRVKPACAKLTLAAR